MNKKILLSLMVLFLCSFLLAGCSDNANTPTKTSNTEKNNVTEKKKKDPSQMTNGEINEELNNINNDITELWNEVFNEVSWYAAEGTSSTGDALDIDFVVSNMDKYYNKVKDDKEFIDKLGDDYKDITSAYSKMFDKATIIYNNIKSQTPKANTDLSYESEIDLFSQYQEYLWNTITELEY